MTIIKSTSVFILLTFSILSNLLAQSPWLNNTGAGFFSFEFSRPKVPFFNGEESFFSASYDIAGGVTIGDQSELIIDLPIAHFNAKNSDFDFDPQTTIGNIYLGFRTGDRSNPVRGEFGVLLPTASDDNELATFIGALAMPNREEKFAADSWGLTAKLRGEDIINDDGLFYRANAGLLYGQVSSDDFDLSICIWTLWVKLVLEVKEGFAEFLGLAAVLVLMTMQNIALMIRLPLSQE
ncbi:hypothetical protein [Reichenbachiella sp.]